MVVDLRPQVGLDPTGRPEEQVPVGESQSEGGGGHHDQEQHMALESTCTLVHGDVDRLTQDHRYRYLECQAGEPGHEHHDEGGTSGPDDGQESSEPALRGIRVDVGCRWGGLGRRGHAAPAARMASPNRARLAIRRLESPACTWAPMSTSRSPTARSARSRADRPSPVR